MLAFPILTLHKMDKTVSMVMGDIEELLRRGRKTDRMVSMVLGGIEELLLRDQEEVGAERDMDPLET